MALGNEQNTGRVNVPGTYRDPESGKELTVAMHAGADALVRMGWELVETPKPVNVAADEMVAAPGPEPDVLAEAPADTPDSTNKD